jgi:hypothetical protein
LRRVTFVVCVCVGVCKLLSYIYMVNQHFAVNVLATVHRYTELRLSRVEISRVCGMLKECKARLTLSLFRVQKNLFYHFEHSTPQFCLTIFWSYKSCSVHNEQ